jgi:hypothetical protein
MLNAGQQDRRTGVQQDGCLAYAQLIDEEEIVNHTSVSVWAAKSKPKVFSLIGIVTRTHSSKNFGSKNKICGPVMNQVLAEVDVRVVDRFNWLAGAYNCWGRKLRWMPTGGVANTQEWAEWRKQVYVLRWI